MAPGEVNISVNLKSVNRGNYIQYNPGAGNGWGGGGRGWEFEEKGGKNELR
jgi:hypothetical protein